jgi:hypothetical protein
MRLIIALLILNSIGGCFVLADFALARFRFDSRGVAQITELDRAGVINQARLTESFPALATNSRYSVGHWITDPAHIHVLRISAVTAILVTSNIILLALYALNLRNSRHA